MGQTLLRLAAERDDLRVVAAVAPPSPDATLLGQPFHPVADLEQVPAFDVAIDFSLPEAFDGLLSLCLERGVALVTGTTGLSDTQRQAMEAASTRIPILWASNFSIGVAVLNALVRRAAADLTGWDCDIIEMHHTRKLDAPSGTALTLGAAAEQGGAMPHYASIRAGDIVGEHVVQFSAPGERIELAHRAGSRDIFARGALQAAAWLAGKPPALHSIDDLLDKHGA